MGVHGLSTFVSREFNGWKRQELSGPLVVDGYSLCYRLYTLPWNQGGEYPQYRDKALEMLHTLLNSNVKPIVIFDGIDYTREKLMTMLKRRRESIKFIHENLSKVNPSHARSVLPTLAFEVLQHVLRELDIPFYVVDGEADGVIVEIANYFSCPVLGSDSDYFMLNISGGYIPTDKLYWTTSPVTCEVFHLSVFLEYFKFRQRSLLFTLPAIVGNDYLTGVFSESLIKCMARSHGIQVPNVHPVSQVVRCIHLYSSLEAFMQATKYLSCSDVLQKNCHTAQAMYISDKRTNPETLMGQSVLFSLNKEPVAEWMVRRYRQGNLSRHVMDILVLGQTILRVIPDVSMKPSSLIASVVLRKRLLFLLSVSMVTEYIRVGGDLTARKVNSLPVSVSVSSQLLFPYPTTMFYEVLECDSSALVALDDEWKFVVAVTRLWAATCSVPTHLVEAMTYCNILCFTCSTNLTDLRQKCVLSEVFQFSYKWMAAVHAFAQWQCCYLDALSVNQLLEHPLKVVSPAYLYDGTIVMYMAQETASVCTKFPIDRRLYQTICNIVLNDRQVAPNQDSTSEQKRVPKAKKRPQLQTTSSFAHVNPFSLLDCDSDTED